MSTPLLLALAVVGWLAIGTIVALMWGKAIAKGQPPEHPTFSLDHPERERVGYLEQHEAERQKRLARSLRRHEKALKRQDDPRPVDRRGRAA